MANKINVVSRNLSELSTMPQMKNAFIGWMKQITLVKVTQSVVDFEVLTSEVSITFEGVIQPLSPKELRLKPEGQRGFEWLQIHCLSGDNDLNLADIVSYNGKRYKIMKINGYSLNNYIEYHLVEDFE